MKQFIAAVLAIILCVQFNAVAVADELGVKQELNGILKAEKERRQRQGRR